jgi:hypothetical protein
VMQPDSAFFDYLNDPNGRGAEAPPPTWACRGPHTTQSKAPAPEECQPRPPLPAAAWCVPPGPFYFHGAHPPNRMHVGLARVSGLGPVETEGSRLLRARFTRPFLRSAR